MTVKTKYITYPGKQLLKKFKHASDFGVLGDCNSQNISEWENALETHMLSDDIKEIRGTFRGKPVIHYFNPTTRLNVVCNENNTFISGWKLSCPQVEALLTTGNLGGG
ncbi:colicin D domain-containing protein [Richelia sinica]|uniref:colicin D domain-containing protein n=1 Tax=Richelia sinica TaxID=1357545 RepID=UPI001689EE6D|nr:hypothetical protein [Richelia sinica FACHB-800]